MENKSIKLLLIAILVVIILQLIPTWGLFLSGMHGTRTETGSTKILKSAINPEPAETTKALDTSQAAETPIPTEHLDKSKAYIIGEPDADG